MGTDGEIEDLTSTENIEASDELIDSKEYEGEDDFGPAKAEPELHNVGTGVIIASIHVDKEHDDDDTVVYAATMAVSNKINPDDDITVAKALMKSVKEDYKTWGSGLKPRPFGKTNQQIKTNSTKDWASNPNVKLIQPDKSGNTQIQRQGLAALINMNGVDAYMCWDSGSELNAISPDFT
jgi:hypothetical protein